MKNQTLSDPRRLLYFLEVRPPSPTSAETAVLSNYGGKKSQKKMRQPASLIKHKPPRRSIFSFCSNKPSKPINSVIFHIGAVSILNEIRFQTCFLSPFRGRSMIGIKEAITFMKRSFQSMPASDSLQIEAVLLIRGAT